VTALLPAAQHSPDAGVLTVPSRVRPSAHPAHAGLLRVVERMMGIEPAYCIQLGKAISRFERLCRTARPGTLSANSNSGYTCGDVMLGTMRITAKTFLSPTIA